jgi:PAS domain S-box-containing protein
MDKKYYSKKRIADSSIDNLKGLEAIKISEQRFRSLIEHTRDAIFCYEYDPPISTNLPVDEQVKLFYQGVLVECNDIAARSYGAEKANEVLGKRLIELFGTESGSLDDFYRMFIEAGYRVDGLEAEEILPDGSKRYFRNNGNGVVEDGMLKRVWGTYQDITGSKGAEKLISIQRDLGLALTTTRDLDEILGLCLRYALLVSDLDCGGIYLFDDETGGMDLVEHTGLPEEFVASGSHYDADSPNVQLVKQGNPIYKRHRDLGIKVDGVRKREGLRALGVIPIHYENKIIACLNVASHELDDVPDNARNSIVTIASQIGNAIARGKAERELDKYRQNLEELVTERTAELIESEKRFRAIFENSPLGIVVISHSNQILEVNQAFSDLLGYTYNELLKMNMVATIHPEDAQEAARGIEKVLAAESEIFHLQPRLVTKQGNPVWVNFIGTILRDNSGQSTFGIGIVEDITERKRTGEELEKLAVDLSRSNEELQYFAYIASHDLQAPLRKILAFSSRLEEKYNDVLDARGHEYLTRMQDAAERGQRLINDLLELSRVTSQGEPFQSTDLNQVLQEVLSDLETHIEREGGHVEAGSLPSIDADPTQMRQLFQNLVGNALKFHKPNTPPSVTVTANADDPNQIQIRVADDGIGFDEELIERVFAPFQRLHSQSEYDGSGIGLSICRKIVERHRGSITAKSVPGEGATFVITLPKQQMKVDQQ